MKELVIDKLGENQRLDKYLSKYLSAASKSFIYKMLRKKNITLNNKKADGSEKLQMGDCIKIFFSDETLVKFTEGKAVEGKTVIADAKTKASLDYEAIYKPLDIVYESDDILLVNKPAGMLSQKAVPQDISLVEYITAYLLHTNAISYEDLKIFHPGICNRLDRNTSGIVAAGKTMKGLQLLSECFKERTLNKYYICIAAGNITQRQLIKGFLKKNHKTNKVEIYDMLPFNYTSENAITADNNRKISNEQYLPIETEYIPVVSNDNITLLKIHLITGRSHQIRAHLASISHPIAGDFKYGNNELNAYFADKYNCKSQLLHSYELEIPDMPICNGSRNSNDNNLHVYTAIPETFIKVLKGENLWQPGIQEALEALY